MRDFWAAPGAKPLIIEAPDNVCGYIDGLTSESATIPHLLTNTYTWPDAPYGCLETSHTCAVYYPTSTWAVTTLAAPITTANATFTTIAPSTALFTLTLTSTVINTLKSRLRRDPKSAPPAITPPPSSNAAVLCCDAANADCTIQPTACVDNFEHPWTSLCLDACRDDPMTLKCVDGALQHCNQVNLESPLLYLDDYQRYPKLQTRALTGQEIAVAEGIVRGWFCGPTPVPTQFKSWSASRATSPLGSTTLTGDTAQNTSSTKVNASSISLPLDASFTSTLSNASLTILPKPGQSAKLSDSSTSSVTQLMSTHYGPNQTAETSQIPTGSSLGIPGFDNPQPGQTCPCSVATSTISSSGQESTTTSLASPGPDEPKQDQTQDEIDCI